MNVFFLPSVAKHLVNKMCQRPPKKQNKQQKKFTTPPKKEKQTNKVQIKKPHQNPENKL